MRFCQTKNIAALLLFVCQKVSCRSLELHSSVCNLNTEGQLIGEKSRMPMANAKVQHRNRLPPSTPLYISGNTISGDTVFTKHCDFPRRAEGYRMGLRVMDDKQKEAVQLCLLSDKTATHWHHQRPTQWKKVGHTKGPVQSRAWITIK